MIDTIRRFKTPSLTIYKIRYNAFNGQKQQNAARTFFFLTTNYIYLQESIGIKTKKIGKQKKKAIYNKVEKDVLKKEVYLIKYCFL